MKRVALQNSKKKLSALFIISALSLFGISTPVVAATLGNAPCVQTIDVTAGVNVYKDGNSCFVAFKTVGSYVWTPPTGVSKVDLLVVAGGGGGGSRHAGGGGAGGLINSEATSINTSALSISVGGGGAGGPATSNAGLEGSNGYNSVVSGSGITTRTAVGGGGGGYTQTSGSGGSSGGGGCCGQAIGTATSGQGNLGSTGYVVAGATYVGGGGGGAGARGSASTSTEAGDGGSGLAISWMTVAAQSNLGVGQNVSSQIYFAGGGGGGTASNSHIPGTGGSGGGAAGSAPTGPGSDATANTGGGGGGSGLNGGGASKGGDGGSGVVVIRYSIPSFTNSATFSIAENTATSTNAATISVSESSTITIRPTLDYALFTIIFSDSVTAHVRFLSSPDYEAAPDIGANNEYDLSVRSTNTSGNYQELAIKITVTNVLEAATTGLPNLSGAAFKGLAVTITISTTVPGRARFFAGGKRIPNCLSRSTIGSYPNYSATCSWKPTSSGPQSISVTLTPTDVAINPVTSATTTFFVRKRGTLR